MFPGAAGTAWVHRNGLKAFTAVVTHGRVLTYEDNLSRPATGLAQAPSSKISYWIPPVDILGFSHRYENGMVLEITLEESSA
jgi:hypothetical protein